MLVLLGPVVPGSEKERVMVGRPGSTATSSVVFASVVLHQYCVVEFAQYRCHILATCGCCAAIILVVSVFSAIMSAA